MRREEPYCRVWTPAGTSVGSIFLVHGLGEHSGRYIHVGEFFSNAGFKVFAPDLRGHGRRKDPPGLIRNYSELCADVVSLLAVREPGPCFLFGHSLGAQIALWLAQQKLVSVDGIIASAPWLRLVNPPDRRLLRFARMLNRFLPNFRFSNRIQPGSASHDQAHLDSLADLELVHNFIRVRMYFEADQAAAELWAKPRIDAPVLVACGGEDLVTSTEATQEFFKILEAPRKDLLFYPGHRHELHNETERAKVLADYLRWMRKIGNMQ
jgi:alpha-beta hydrolase superfamily lysophospholipase